MGSSEMMQHMRSLDTWHLTKDGRFAVALEYSDEMTTTWIGERAYLKELFHR